MSQIKKNARAVADRAASDWEMAYIVACSVENNGPGGDRKSGSNEGSRLIGKSNIAEFARMVKEEAGGNVYGMGEKGIGAFLRKWDQYVADGVIPAWGRLDRLTPADAADVKSITWPDMPFKGSTYVGEGTPINPEGSKVQDVRSNARAVAEALNDPGFAAKVSQHASPKARANVYEHVTPKPLPESSKRSTVWESVEEAVVPRDSVAQAYKAVKAVYKQAKTDRNFWTPITAREWEDVVDLVAKVSGSNAYQNAAQAAEMMKERNK